MGIVMVQMPLLFEPEVEVASELPSDRPPPQQFGLARLIGACSG
jgi:hypothetical protein